MTRVISKPVEDKACLFHIIDIVAANFWLLGETQSHDM